jgi:uncharacterized protein YciI
MPTFAYRILPPREAFVATIRPEEMAVMGRHWEHIQRLHAQGTVLYVGRAENGDYGFCVIEAADEAEARRIAGSDPAVAEGLMRLEVHAFHVVLDRPAPGPTTA